MKSLELYFDVKSPKYLELMVVFTQQTGGENIEEELGLAGATADDAEIEYIRRLCEKEVVSGNNNQSKILDVLSLIIYAHKINMYKHSPSDTKENYR